MHFDFVVSDLHLPEKIDGIDLLALTKSSAHAVGALLISGDSSEQAKEKAAALGAIYMEKPIELKVVARIIEAGIGKQKP